MHAISLSERWKVVGKMHIIIAICILLSAHIIPNKVGKIQNIIIAFCVLLDHIYAL